MRGRPCCVLALLLVVQVATREGPPAAADLTAGGADLAALAAAADEGDVECGAGSDEEACGLSLRQLRAQQRGELEEHREDWPTIFGTTEKCCKCKTGEVGWSASGTCSFCNGKVQTTKSVTSDCVKANKNFQGNTACATACQKVVGLMEVGATAAVVAEDEALAEWPSIFGTTEKCCKCKTGEVGWSASGTCSFCNGKVQTTKSVSADCVKSSKTFQGNTACASLCQKSVGLMEVAAQTAAVAEDEALAEWPSIFGTTEKCCKCATGDVGWSASGTCSFCNGKVKTTKSVSSDCVKSSKTFLGNTACATACQKVVGLMEVGATDIVPGEDEAIAAVALLDVADAAASEDEAVAEAVADGEARAVAWPSIFGTTEKCCKCKSGTVGWSASGTCSFCAGQVATTKSVGSDCTVKDKNFKGNKVCADLCKQQVQGYWR